MDDTNPPSCPMMCPAANDHQRLPTLLIALAHTRMTRKIKTVHFVQSYLT
jgi:hypothetical protein